MDRDIYNVILGKIGSLAERINALPTQPTENLQFAYGEVDTETIEAGNNANVSVTIPTGGTTVKAVIPYGFLPGSHWTSQLIFIKSENDKIYYRCVGSGATQIFTVRYVIIYV